MFKQSHYLVMFSFIILSSMGHCGSMQIVYLDTDEFIAGRAMTVAIDPFAACVSLTHNVDNEFYDYDVQENEINLYLVATSLSPCPIHGSDYREEYTITAPQTPGNYELNVFTVHPEMTFPVDPNNGFTPIESVNLNVIRGQAVSVNSLSKGSLLLLISVLITTTVLYQPKKHF